ncbi:MAG TPA: tRNA/tmRNA/rRNA uracil-C5-methylase, partial [Propionibacteriaceae bacterium]|nr:tRNA/tmRNA/rRNA uracil-C5-methylase [Propionibacteriaceae bacterium]
MAVVGDIVGPVAIERVAHGGHCVGRWEGVVHFVRHALPGEQVMVKVTEVAKRYVRSDVVEVVQASPERVTPRCSVAGLCGGCDWQHAEPAYTRELKRQVIAEQLRHLGGYTWEGAVEEVEPAPFHWRTRMRYAATADGRPGLKAHRSNRVVPLPPEGCVAAVPAIANPGRLAGETIAVAPGKGRPVLVGAEQQVLVEEVAAGRYWRVSSNGFWQSHPQAADTLVQAVLEGLEPRADEVA